MTRLLVDIATLKYGRNKSTWLQKLHVGPIMSGKDCRKWNWRAWIRPNPLGFPRFHRTRGEPIAPINNPAWPGSTDSLGQPGNDYHVCRIKPPEVNWGSSSGNPHLTSKWSRDTHGYFKTILTDHLRSVNVCSSQVLVYQKVNDDCFWTHMGLPMNIEFPWSNDTNSRWMEVGSGAEFLAGLKSVGIFPLFKSETQRLPQ